MSPELRWDHPHLEYVRDQLADVTLGDCRKLLVAWPPQHYKTWSTTVRYPLWRMLREPGLRVGVGTYNQRYANKISRWTRKLVERMGLRYADSGAVDTWTLENGSTYIARGAGVGLAGEPVDLWVCDDPFKKREEADSPVVQENVWEWHMDDVTPRIQQGGAAIVIQARWNPGDLIGRIRDSEDGSNWRYVELKAVAEAGDPLGREAGSPLCAAAFSAESLADKRRVMGVGFESLYQQNPIPRGGTFFERAWFEVVGASPDAARRARYWDLARSRKDSACYTSGVLMAVAGEGDGRTYYVEDVVRGRWAPGERNEVMLNTARADATRPGFDRTWFESPTHDTGSEASRAILAKLSGFPVRGDKVSGTKEMRAEPLADAARGRLVKLVAGPWVGAYLTELESFPHGTYKDQVDSSSGVFNKLARGGAAVVLAGGGR